MCPPERERRTWPAVALLGLAATAALAFGCGGRPTFSHEAFYPPRDHYRIRTGDDYPWPHRLLSNAWRLDNYRTRDQWVGQRKEGPDYRREIRIDSNDDGRVDQRHHEYLYDLRLVHANDASVIWARTTPLPSIARDRRPEVLAHDLVDRIGGSNYFEVSFWGELSQRRMGTRVVSEGPVVLNGGVAGWMITFDVIARDQAETDPRYVGDRVTLVVVHPPGVRWRPNDVPATQDGLPMLVIFGLAARGELHDQHREELLELVSRVDFHYADSE